MKRKKVLLITPPYHSGVVESAGVWLNVGFVYIAGSLRQAGYEVEIYDAMSYWVSEEDVERKIANSKPEVVATTSITASIVSCLKVLDMAKKINPEIITVLGNVHPTFCYQEILENHDQVDFIVRGEGEITLVELLDCLEAKDDVSKVKSIAYRKDGQVFATAPRPYIQDLDSLPTAWDLIDWKIYKYRAMDDARLAIVSSSRGCSMKCSFCSQQLFWKRHWRGRSPENFVQELELLRDKYGVQVVMLSDETPTLNRKRWERILDLLIDRNVGIKILMETRVDDIVRDENILWKYKAAGIDHIYVGVESASQKTLNLFHKDIRVEQSKKALQLINDQDIVTETSLVLGMPEDTPESFRQALEFAKYYNPDMAFFLAIAPWPYSEIYPQLKDYIEVHDYSHYNLVEPVVKPKNMTLKEVFKELGHASRDFYMYKLQNLNKFSAKKREFMVKVIRIIATSSYLAGHMKGMMPEEVKKILATLEI